MRFHAAAIAIGSNLEDRLAYIAFARQELGQLPDSRLEAFSSVIETPPVGPAGQGYYLNACALLQTSLGPIEVFSQLRRIEALAGRERRERWAARTLDLDLLLYDDMVMQTAELTLPHPRMHERPFVLLPLQEIAPRMIHPLLGKTVTELAAHASAY